MNIIEIKNITKTIKKQKVIDNITLNIKENKIIGLIGPNGAGKTTLLKLIVGLLKPTMGEIKINTNKIGSLIEGPSFYENLNAVDNLMYFCNLDNNINKEEVKSLLKKLNLPLRRKVKAFSLGMKQTLGIIYACMFNPELIILDEPTNALDPIAIRNLRDYIKSLKNTTVIISSHLISEIEKLCDEVVFINKGKVIKVIESDLNNIEECFMEVISYD